MRKYGSINGFLIAIFAIFGAFIIEGGSLKALFLVAPLIIVFGGTFAAILIGFGWEKFVNIFRLVRLAYFPKEYDMVGLIDKFYDLALKARKNGLLPLEDELDEIDDFFTKKMLRFMIDGMSAEQLENMAILEMKALDERHQANIVVFNKMGGYAPTMGILGTVMALIMTMANAGSDPNLLIRNIATAFIATLWGVLSANVIWLPISDKLRQCHLQEKMMMDLTLEGTLALLSGEIPMLMRTRLISMLPQKSQKDLIE
ncbi:MAG: chemotaxis protein MotA [Ignavibacteria bacterium]|nr:MAG: chemotaxis protein MotA [Ignavibacteria bacterium]